MAKAYDVFAYHYDGAAYCEDCGGKIDGAEPVFEVDADAEIGATCDTCRMFVVLGDYGVEWRLPEDAGNVWWRICPACNSHVPADSAETALEAPECCRQHGTRTGDGRRLWTMQAPQERKR